MARHYVKVVVNFDALFSRDYLEMSKKIVKALSTGEELYLQGTIALPHLSENRAAVLVVIVDDNSGSMQGPRAVSCVEKTKV